MSVYWAFVVGLVIAAVSAGAIASHCVGAAADSPGSVRGRSQIVLNASSTALGPVGGFIHTALTGVAATIALCWPLGKLFGRTESAVDEPIFRWAQERQASGWTSLQNVLTQMGNRTETKIVVVVVAVGLAIVWRNRGWWIPPVALISTYGTEKYVQGALALVVNRGHPPTTLGTYPSGGCARLVTVWGMSLVLVSLTWRLSRRVQVGLWTLLAVAALLEGYARTYLLQHWFTDVLGGWIYGSLLLLTYATATTALLRARSSPTQPSGPSRLHPSLPLLGRPPHPKLDG